MTAQDTLQNGATQEIVTTFANYGMVWTIYIGLVFLMVAIIWYAIRKWHFTLKWLMASLIFAGALTPGHPVDYAETYSPLVLNSVVLLFDGDKTGFMAGAKTLAWVFVLVYVLGIAAWLGFKFWRKQQAQKAADQPSKAEATKASKEAKAMATPIEPTLGDDEPKEPR